jgi:hypothetical protein
LDPYSQGYPSHRNSGGTIINLIRELRDTSGVPVNVIVSDEQIRVSCSTTGQDVAAVLEALVAQTARYRWRTITGHYVLYPSDPVWDSKISGIAIRSVPRLDAATQYVTAVRSQIPALADLVEPPMKGDSRAPVYTEPVSLPLETSIVTHLVELLGTNDQLAFTIERARSGQRVLHFQQVTATPCTSDDDWNEPSIS